MPGTRAPGGSEASDSSPWSGSTAAARPGASIEQRAKLPPCRTRSTATSTSAPSAGGAAKPRTASKGRKPFGRLAPKLSESPWSWAPATVADSSRPGRTDRAESQAPCRRRGASETRRGPACP